MKQLGFLLSISLSLVFLTASCQQSRDTSDTIQKMNTDDFRKAINSKDGILLDVRTPEEFSEGRIPGSINIDYNSENFREEIEKLDHSKQYNVYCKSGRRSGEAAKIMKDAGFVKIATLEGGIVGWEEKNYEVVK